MTSSCPLCDHTHEACQFTSGSLYCIKPDCQNPHHRPSPVNEDDAA